MVSSPRKKELVRLVGKARDAVHKEERREKMVEYLFRALAYHMAGDMRSARTCLSLSSQFAQ